MNYNYEKENHKKCPVCGKDIDYHFDGLIHIEPENKWFCRRHLLGEITNALGRSLNAEEKEVVRI